MDNPAGYLWGVGRNHARRMRPRRVVLPHARVDAMPWIEPSLASALARLSEGQRVAVMLVHGLGWTYGEVAELLGVSRGTVQTHVGMERDDPRLIGASTCRPRNREAMHVESLYEGLRQQHGLLKLPSRSTWVRIGR